ncbi:MAG TPA: 1,4-alpha-glucan branching protein domain-containing protein [Vicinamibacteria bacterium]|nr:1,4-alpha-glucan branching protein domain-containing protein [Vicinamibacteria bacterium]
MPGGYFALVLHAHLPFVRHPRDPTVMEERWLYEAITGTYLPLLQMFEGLVKDGVPFRCTVSLSPPLLSMLADDLLQERTAHYLNELIRLGEIEIERTEKEPYYQRLALMYRSRFESLRNTWRYHGGNLIAAFRKLQDSKHLEVITSTATHAFFPLMDGNWSAMRAQVDVAADLYAQYFGEPPRGMWLGECGYVPGVDELLREAAVRYFVVDAHAILHGDAEPVYGVYAPVYCPSGVAAFARDTDSSEQVWSAEHGYPGDPQYRDFYRDIGFDLPLDQIGPFVHPEGHRLYTGYKYHAITHQHLHDKWVYEPDAARGRAGLHASHFRGNLEKQVERLASGMDRPPIIVSPYDAELFGHWWFEGPIFLGDVFRQLHYDQNVVECMTPGEYLDRFPTNQRLTPSLSSWGLKGFNEQWLNESNAWTWPHVHMAGARMVELAREHLDQSDALTRRALRQASRELLLAESSDWAFIMSTGTTVEYATRRFNEHILAFNRLYDDIKGRKISESFLTELEDRDNLFPQIDYRVFAT